MIVGDKVKMSDKNRNHLGNDVCAYAGMEGLVTDVYDDGAFALRCNSARLIVPMNNAYKRRIKGVWIWLNGVHMFYKSIAPVPTKSVKWYDWFILKFGSPNK